MISIPAHTPYSELEVCSRPDDVPSRHIVGKGEITYLFLHHIMNRKEQFELLGFRDTWVVILGIPVLAFLIPLLFFGATLENGLAAYLEKLPTSLLFTAAYWLTIRSIFLVTRRKWPRHEQTNIRLWVTLASILTAFFIIHFGLGSVHEAILPGRGNEGVSDFTFAVASLTITLLVSSLYEGIYFYSRWRLSLVEQERLRRQNIESQLEGLKNQVNPHFLFNSLNTLVYLIPEDPERAVKLVRKLSKAYRYILEMRDKQIIPLEEELQFLEAYLFLLKERFGDNLRVQVDIPTDRRRASVVPMSLQMLVENAVKHNVISEDHPLHLTVRVDASGRRLEVCNNLQPRKQALPSTKLGLANISSRYAFFTDLPVDVSRLEKEFRVSLPLLNLPVSPVQG